jgi:hypothetical protein
MKPAAITLIAIVCLSCAHAGAPSDADLVLPGTFSEGTTLSDLQARFGAANVVITDVPDGDGATSRIVLLYPDDPARRATARFWDEDTLVHLSSVTVTDPESRWRGKLGVRIGTTFAELRRLNGAEFFYEGFYPDGSGRVRDGWNAGALDVAEGDHLYSGVELALRPPPGTDLAKAAPNEEMQTSSDDPLYPQLGELAVVSALTAWSSLDDEW